MTHRRVLVVDDEQSIRHVLQRGSAEEGLALVREAAPEVVVMTSHSSVDTAIRAIRDGAYDYQQKPRV